MQCSHDSDQEREYNSCAVQSRLSELCSSRFYSVLTFTNLLSVLSTVSRPAQFSEGKATGACSLTTKTPVMTSGILLNWTINKNTFRQKFKSRLMLAGIVHKSFSSFFPTVSVRDTQR